MCACIHVHLLIINFWKISCKLGISKPLETIWVVIHSLRIHINSFFKTLSCQAKLPQSILLHLSLCWVKYRAEQGQVPLRSNNKVQKHEKSIFLEASKHKQLK